MAKYKIKGNKIIGTNKGDKIVWKSAMEWRKTFTVKGRGGNDLINFVKSPYKKNKLYGGAGNDKIVGTMKMDYIYGDDGNDTIIANAGNDRIYAGAGFDLIDGGSGKDKIWCDSGANAVLGGGDNDTIYGSTGFDAIAAGDGDDVIKLSKYAESSESITLPLKNKTLRKIFGGASYITLNKNKRTVVDGGAGNDKIYDIQGGAYVDGYKGSDTITAISGNNTLKGGSGNDSITGGSGNDYIDGGTKNDTIKATGGNNTILGGTGNDNIKSGSGNDYIDGGSHNDTINAGNGDNTVYGGSGNDSIVCGSGDDIIYGGQQNDTINAGGGNNTIYYGSQEGSDVIISGGGNDTIVFNGISWNLIGDNNHKGRYSGNDLIIDIGSTKTMTLKDFKICDHSVKTLVIDGVEHNISEFDPLSSRSLSMAPRAKTALLAADVAAWQSDNSGYSEVAPIVGTEEANPLVAVANNCENNQLFNGNC